VDERRIREFQANSLQRHAIEFGEWMVHASNDTHMHWATRIYGRRMPA
jgi:hypothetical protein